MCICREKDDISKKQKLGAQRWTELDCLFSHRSGSSANHLSSQLQLLPSSSNTPFSLFPFYTSVLFFIDIMNQKRSLHLITCRHVWHISFSILCSTKTAKNLHCPHIHKTIISSCSNAMLYILDNFPPLYACRPARIISNTHMYMLCFSYSTN